MFINQARKWKTGSKCSPQIQSHPKSMKVGNQSKPQISQKEKKKKKWSFTFQPQPTKQQISREAINLSDIHCSSKTSLSHFSKHFPHQAKRYSGEETNKKERRRYKTHRQPDKKKIYSNLRMSG